MMNVKPYTLSNVAYIIGAYALWFWGLEEKTLNLYVMSGLLFLLGIASWYYHAGGKYGNHLDVGMMYVIGLSIAAYNFAAGSAWWIASLPLIVGAMAWLRFGQDTVIMESKIGGLYFVAWMSCWLGWPVVGTWWLLGSLVAFVSALLIRDQNHDAWHGLSALGLS